MTNESAESDGAEAKKQRKAAKRAAAAAEAIELEAKRQRKAAKRSAAEVREEVVDKVDLDAAEAKKLRKAKKLAVAEALLAESVQDSVEPVAAEAKQQRKGGKLATVPAPEEQAAKLLTPAEIEERSLKRKERKKREKEAKKTRTDEMTVFVSGLPFDSSETSVCQHFSSCGEVECIKLLLDKSGKPRGLAYISYKTLKAAKAAGKLDRTTFGSRELSVKPSSSKPSHNRDLEVFVKHFPRDESDSNVKKFFARCGVIESLRIPRFADGAAKGMAWIVFKDYGGVAKALKLDGKQMGDKWVQVEKSGKEATKPS